MSVNESVSQIVTKIGGEITVISHYEIGVRD
jgi:hypothetical protein